MGLNGILGILLSYFLGAFLSTPTLAYSLDDLRPQSPACEEALQEPSTSSPQCSPASDQSADSIQKSFVDIHKSLAINEIKKNVRTTAGLQIEKSLELLQQVGVEKFNPALQRQLDDLNKRGFKTEPKKQTANTDLSEQYLLASLRYHQMQKISSASSYLQTEERTALKERMGLLEARYPLIAQHGFSKLNAHATAFAKATMAAPKESAEEAMILDNYLFNQTPSKISELDLKDLVTTSAIGKITQFQSNSQNTKFKKQLHEVLKEELQTSLTRQLNALKELDSFSDCEVLTLHSEVSLLAIQSSPSSANIFKAFCECNKNNPLVSDRTMLVGGLVAGAAGLLCIAPTGIGQLIACPTAMVAGWGTAGASAVNFSQQMNRYSSYQDQGSVLQVLESGKEESAEKELLSKKESELGREMVTDNMFGLIGFGVGHVGFSSLTSLYSKSKVSTSFNRATQQEKQELTQALSTLSKEDQTRAFVVLDKLDDEARQLLIKKPNLLEREVRGGRCGL